LAQSARAGLPVLLFFESFPGMEGQGTHGVTKAMGFRDFMACVADRSIDANGLKDLRAKVSRNYDFLWMKTEGLYPWQFAVLNDFSIDVIDCLYTSSEELTSLASLEFRNEDGRLPLHIALGNRSFHLVSKLLEAYPKAAGIRDGLGILPLHTCITISPFPSNGIEVCQKLIKLFPQAVKENIQDKTLLHVGLEVRLPPRLFDDILVAHRAATSKFDGSGKLPLHLALELDYDIRVVDLLLKAYPRGLLCPMSCRGQDILPIQYVIQTHRQLPLVSLVMHGGMNEQTPDDPLLIACARAALEGRKARPYTQHVVQPRAKSKGRMYCAGQTKDFEALLDSTDDAKYLDIVVFTEDWVHIVVRMKPNDKVDQLKEKLYQLTGVPLRSQRLTYRGITMSDSHSLAQYNFTMEYMVKMEERSDILHLALRSPRDFSQVALRVLDARPELAFQPDGFGILPLHAALMSQASLEVIEKLVCCDQQATLKPLKNEQNLESHILEYPIHLGLRKTFSPKVIRMLLDGVSREDFTEEGTFAPVSGKFTNTKRQWCPEAEAAFTHLPMHLAIDSYDAGGTLIIEVVDLLLEKNCPITAINRVTGETILECLLRNGASEKFFYSLFPTIVSECIFVLTHQGPGGRTPIHTAVQHDNPVAIIELL